MAAHIPAYAGVAKRPAKFCHGFGIFQLDLQFFRTDPGYFLQRDYDRFDMALGKCLGELNRVLRKLGFEGREALSDTELAAVGIAYNTGTFWPAKAWKQPLRRHALLRRGDLSTSCAWRTRWRCRALRRSSRRCRRARQCARPRRSPPRARTCASTRKRACCACGASPRSARRRRPT
jgi:hypothetical protein